MTFTLSPPCARRSVGENGALSGLHPVAVASLPCKRWCVGWTSTRAAVEDVVMGCVTPIGEQGTTSASLAVLNAGWPVSVPSVTLNRMCGSSQQAIHFAAQAIATGDMDVAVGARVECMSPRGYGLRLWTVLCWHPLRPDSAGHLGRVDMRQMEPGPIRTSITTAMKVTERPPPPPPPATSRLKSCR